MKTDNANPSASTNDSNSNLDPAEAAWMCCGQPVTVVGLDIKCNVCERVSR